uniref:Uncharacterized protein n=1 Tax=Anguilla anguilla TaxID=7936 RepID=A0A0E9XT52_ANGAN
MLQNLGLTFLLEASGSFRGVHKYKLQRTWASPGEDKVHMRDLSNSSAQRENCPSISILLVDTAFQNHNYIHSEHVIITFTLSMS